MTYEYAIELPGQGWLLCATPSVYSVVTEPVIIADHIDDARKSLAKAQNFYSRIGAESVGSQLRLVARTITVVRSDWEEVTA